jgi:hypothetical protein
VSELSGAVGADYLVSGSLARVGKSVTFEAEIMEPTHATVLQRYESRVKNGSDEELLDEADKAAVALIPKPLWTDPNAAPSGAAATSTTTAAGTTTATVATTDVALERALVFAAGGTTELIAKGGWLQARGGYRFMPELTVSVGGLFTGQKNGGALADVSSTPLFADAVVRPVVGLAVPVLFGGSTYVGLVPHVGAEWMATDLVGLSLEVPLMIVLNAPSGSRSVYPMGSLSVVLRLPAG